MSKTRVSSTSPLPSLQEQEDPQEEVEEEEKRRRRRMEEKEEDRGNRSTDSIRGGHYQRSNKQPSFSLNQPAVFNDKAARMTNNSTHFPQG